jgi:hypothetical protein
VDDVKNHGDDINLIASASLRCQFLGKSLQLPRIPFACGLCMRVASKQPLTRSGLSAEERFVLLSGCLYSYKDK